MKINGPPIREGPPGKQNKLYERRGARADSPRQVCQCVKITLYFLIQQAAGEFIN